VVRIAEGDRPEAVVPEEAQLTVEKGKLVEIEEGEKDSVAEVVPRPPVAMVDDSALTQ
jgi:hypothetical protein